MDTSSERKQQNATHYSSRIDLFDCGEGCAARASAQSSHQTEVDLTRRSLEQDLPTSKPESSEKPGLQTEIFEDRKMDESRVQQTESVFKDNQPNTKSVARQRELALPPAERSSDNDEHHAEEGFQTFILGYN